MEFNNGQRRGLEWLYGAAGRGELAAQVDFDDGVGEDDGMPEAPDEKVLAGLRDRWVYCLGLDRYMDLTTGILHPSKAFIAMNTAVARFGKSGEHAADAIFQNLPRARKVATATYRPGQAAIVRELVNGQEHEAVNTYRPSFLKPHVGAVPDADVSPWLGHITGLFGVPGAQAREHFLNYMAFIVQRPGEKINHAPVLLGEEGIGKDTACEPLRRALGAHNTATIDPSELTAAFNGHWIDRQFVIVNEAHTFHRRETMNILKPIIAEPPHTLIVNRKNVPQYTVPNKINVAMFTNHDDALAPTQGDRRYWVHKCLIDVRPPESYFVPIWDWLNAGGDAKCFAWLLARDVSAFNPKAPAPMTDAKQDMIDQSSPAPVRWLRGQFGEGGKFAGRTVLTIKEVTDAADQDHYAPNVSDKFAASVLKTQGFYIAGRVRVWAGEEAVQLWVRDPSGLLAQQVPSKLKDRYLAEGGKKGFAA